MERAGEDQTQSEAGYRLLLVGGRYVTDAEYEVWLKELLKAEKAMKNREEVSTPRVADA